VVLIFGDAGRNDPLPVPSPKGEGVLTRFASYFVAILIFAQIASAQAASDEQLRSAGIRTITGRHLVLLTDLASDPEIEKLPAIFDEAVGQWAEYFGVDPGKTADWQVRAHLIGERRRFDGLGLMPAANNTFVNGISIGSELWLYDQPTAYYRRHLLLHEGTHAFMVSFLGGCGPGWYMEGTAELLATHRLDERTGKLTLGIMPKSREEVPMLGRIKLIRDAVEANRSLTFEQVMQIDNRQQLGNESYAWTWAAAKFLDAHPRYRGRFRRLHNHVLDREFNSIMRREYRAHWSELTNEWQAFVATLDHGYDFERMAIDFARGRPLGEEPSSATIQADRGWQSSGVWLDAGKSYQISASGRYQIAADQAQGALRPWPCEPGGVTIEYHDGRPLGILLGAVVGPKNSGDASLAKPIAVGLGTTFKAPTGGTLYLRVNDSAAVLHDNRGTLSATVALASD
jgi:hypothetical protein